MFDVFGFYKFEKIKSLKDEVGELNQETVDSDAVTNRLSAE